MSAAARQNQPRACQRDAGRQDARPAGAGPRRLTALSFAGISWLLTLPAGAADSTPGLPEAGFSVLRVCGALAVVLALFLGGVWLFKNWQRLALQRGGVPKLNVLEVKPLGQRHALYVVGYERQRMLLASSPAGVTLISYLPGDDVAAEAPPAPVDFTDVLCQALTPKT